jgi:hypothetical protein
MTLYRVQVLSHGRGPWRSFLDGVFINSYDGDPRMYWLSAAGSVCNPGDIYVGGRFFFTAAGMHVFMKRTFPCLGSPFNLRVVSLEEITVPSEISIAYRDQYQVCLAAKSRQVLNELLRLIQEKA